MERKTHPRTNGKLQSIKSWTELIRDIGLILGLPALILIGKGLYERQIEVLKSQIETLKTEKELYKQTQYDKAWPLMESQKKLFESIHAKLNEQIEILQKQDEEKSESLEKMKGDVEKLSKAVNILAAIQIRPSE